MKGRSFWCSTRASASSPAKANRTSRAKGPGAALAATETRPTAPTAIEGRAKASSPDRSVLPGGRVRAISPIWAKLPEDSLRATSSGISQSRATRAGPMLRPVLPGTL